MKRNLNIKLLNAVQKGLNEALSNYDLTILDDEDDSVLVNNDAYKHSSIYDDIIDRFSEYLDDDKMFKNIVEKMLLTNKQYTVKDRDELKTLVKKSIKIFGNECNLNWLDTSLITDMTALFYGMKDFNGHIENWDMSNVNCTAGMFAYAKSFNQPISDWDVSNVKDMHSMFSGVVSFNQPIGDWNINYVNDISYMFNCAYSFNQPIENWDVSSVKDMNHMFSYATTFNQPIGNWDVSCVKDMRYMFDNAKSFNQQLNNWNVSNVKNNYYMFNKCPIKEEYKPKFNK